MQKQEDLLCRYMVLQAEPLATNLFFDGYSMQERKFQPSIQHAITVLISATTTLLVFYFCFVACDFRWNKVELVYFLDMYSQESKKTFRAQTGLRWYLFKQISIAPIDNQKTARPIHTNKLIQRRRGHPRQSRGNRLVSQHSNNYMTPKTHSASYAEQIIFIFSYY